MDKVPGSRGQRAAAKLRRSARESAPMSQMFDIAISKQLSTDDLAAAITELLPPGFRIDIRHDIAELPEEPGAVWATLVASEDAAWPRIFKVLVCRDECDLGEYPDVRIAESLWERYGAYSLCGTYPFVGELDPYDPYWSLAFIKGKWYLASTSGTQLMGPYTDGITTFPGDEVIQLVRAVSIPQ